MASGNSRDSASPAEDSGNKGEVPASSLSSREPVSQPQCSLGVAMM
ncbi:MAG TPA: hypothetical protein VL485_00395 [Ktedonobacteraceae bacterium]|nr:hypothetical protein [Ktedonobacteraceae bacterium]